MWLLQSKAIRIQAVWDRHNDVHATAPTVSHELQALVVDSECVSAPSTVI